MRARTSLFLLAPLGVLGLASFQGCGDDSTATTSTLTSSGGSASSASAQGGNNQGGSVGTFVGSGASTGVGGDEGCVEQSAETTFVNKPVDIIIVIDNSGSMGDEIDEVEEQINLNFASILDAAMPPIDYRVVMVSSFASGQEICVSAPLGGKPDANMDGHCDDTQAPPINTSKFFHHSVSIGSEDALCKLLQYHDQADEYGLQPNGYKDVLRPDAFKFFLVITDDSVDCGPYNDGNNVNGGLAAATQWDADLLALNPTMFGADPTTRNYSFWTIASLAPFMPSGMKPYGDPHPPDDTVAPIVAAECTPSAQDPGTGYQALSIMTGGYRFPTCGLDYTEIFSLMAQGVIAGAQTPCTFEIPEPPGGQTIDLNTVKVKYSSSDMLLKTLEQVPSAADCNDNSFYIENNQVIICPEICDVIQADENAKVDIVYGCAVTAD